MASEAEKREELLISYNYPHSLMMHISAIFKEKKITDPAYLLDLTFIDIFEARYRSYPNEIAELDTAYEEHIIDEFIEAKRAPEWKKRVVVSRSVDNLMKKLREYEVVELVETLMFLFHWEFEIKLQRKWEIPEEEKAWYHDSFRPQNISEEEFKKKLRGYVEQQSLMKKNGEKQKIHREYLSEEPVETEKFREDEKKRRTAEELSEKRERETVEEKRKKKIGEKKLHAKEPGRRRASKDKKTENRIGGARPGPNSWRVWEMSEEDCKADREVVEIKHEEQMSPSTKKETGRARRGDARAQRQLGDFYAKENTGHTDYKEAVRWYGYAAKKGDLKAKLAMGKIFDGNLLPGEETKEMGIRYFEELAEDGYPTAQSILGFKYYFGDGVKKDLGKAISWFKQAAEQGSVDAQRQLGEIYSSLYEPEEAKKWFEKAASAGDASSKYKLKKM